MLTAVVVVQRQGRKRLQPKTGTRKVVRRGLVREDDGLSTYGSVKARMATLITHLGEPSRTTRMHDKHRQRSFLLWRQCPWVRLDRLCIVPYRFLGNVDELTYLFGEVSDCVFAVGSEGWMNDERCCAGCLEKMSQGRDRVVGGEEESRMAYKR